MILVICGAGASHDSNTLNGAGRLPLVKTLFDDEDVNNEAMQMYPNARPLAMLLRRAVMTGTGSIEDELAKYTAQAENDDSRARQLMALRHYLQRVVSVKNQKVLNHRSGLTNYNEVVEQLVSWSHRTKETICFVNFNYDTTLERAIGDQGIGWSTTNFEGYVKLDDVWVIKPHGSIDWVRRGYNPLPGQSYDVIQRAPEIDISSFDIQLSSTPQSDMEISIPALAVPVTGKTTFECPAVILEKLEQAICESHMLISLGWRGAENHFVPMLAKMQHPISRLIVTESEEAKEDTVKNLEPAGLDVRMDKSFVEGFTSFVRSGKLDEFLEESMKSLHG